MSDILGWLREAWSQRLRKCFQSVVRWSDLQRTAAVSPGSEGRSRALWAEGVPMRSMENQVQIETWVTHSALLDMPVMLAVETALTMAKRK